MKLTLKALEKMNPCGSGLAWWKLAACKTVESTISKLITEDRLDWANWLIVRVITHDQQIKYAIFAARKVLDIYEKQCPGDNRARRAVEAAEIYLKDKTETNRVAAANAANAAKAANAAAYAAANAANAANAAAMKKETIEYGVSLLAKKNTAPSLAQRATVRAKAPRPTQTLRKLARKNK